MDIKDLDIFIAEFNNSDIKNKILLIEKELDANIYRKSKDIDIPNSILELIMVNYKYLEEKCPFFKPLTLIMKDNNKKQTMTGKSFDSISANNGTIADFKVYLAKQREIKINEIFE